MIRPWDARKTYLLLRALASFGFGRNFHNQYDLPSGDGGAESAPTGFWWELHSKLRRFSLKSRLV